MQNFIQKKYITMMWILAIILTFTGFVFADEIHVAIIDSGARGYADEGVSFTSYSAVKDPLDHGTQIAKLIRQGNPTVRIHMLQVCDKIDGVLKPSRNAILQAVKWCIENKMDIVNMSLVINYDREIEELINNAATSHGILFIAAAGNRTINSHFAADQDGFMHRASKLSSTFPAFNPHVIAVGGLNERGKIAGYSNKICDIYEKGKILGQEGSSFACARITSRVARILSVYPLSTKEEILSYLNL